jgi:DUF1365 family protein
MHSAIYQGRVEHHRFLPKRHQLRYNLFMMYLDLDELDQVLSLSPFWSRSRWALAKFCRRDFIGDPEQDLKTTISQKIKEATGEVHNGPIRMLANLRYFGFNINPIVCYYCFDQQERLQNLVVEVHNTPWGERITYVLTGDPDSQLPRKLFSQTFNKNMHVSPFNPMDMQYLLSSNTPCEKLQLNIQVVQEGQRHMNANLQLRHKPITAKTLNRTLLTYPLMTLKTAASIHWQALKLLIKGVPLYSHPKYLDKKIEQ